MSINLGETRQLTTTFEQAGLPYDPASVVLIITTPTAVSTAVGPGAPIINDAVGTYRYNYVTTEIGNTFITWVATDVGGNVVHIPEVVEVVPARMMPRVMTSDELDQCVGPAKVDQLFDDQATGQRDRVLVSQALRRGEDYAISYLLNAWDEPAIVIALQNDSLLRMHVAWIVLELAAERRSEFCGVDGKGPYWSQMQRADKYLDSMSRGRTSSTAEAKGAGKNAQVGGRVNPRLSQGESRFVFAPDRRFPRGHGGY